MNYSVGMIQLPSIPALPASWPFPVRGSGGAFEARPLAEVPGVLGAWHLVLPAGLVFEGTAAAVEGVFGRGGLRRAGDVVIRPYRRGGLVRHFDETLYFNPVRFARELMVHNALWAAGFPTVEPLGYGYRRRLVGVEGLYFTRFRPSTPWPSCWERSPEVLPRLEAALEALCAWGLWAPDLNATNVLVAEDGEVLLLDWDKAAWCPGQDLMPKYRARMARSLKKLGAPEEAARHFN